MLKKIIGIDLGTSNSIAAIKKLNVEVFENAEGEELTPSCVYFDPKSSSPLDPKGYFVGRNAKNIAKKSPLTTFFHVKRLIGRSFKEDVVQKYMEEAYSGQYIQEDQDNLGNVRLQVPTVSGDHNLTPEDISSLILKKIKIDCEEKLNEEVRNVVITVPAYFNDKQKYATKVAASKAGLNVLRLLPEPTAAAMAFGDEFQKNHGKDLTQTFLVYDFGGGTLDISLLTTASGQYIEQAKTGDMWLGGGDLDEKLVDLILQKGSGEEGEDLRALIDKLPIEKKSFVRRELLEEAEKAKVDLSSNTSSHIQKIAFLEGDDGIPIDLDVNIERSEFNQIIEESIDKSCELIKDLLNSQKMTSEDIDSILLVGGSSQIPLVKEKLADIFTEEKIHLHRTPMTAIAQGAAVLAHRLTNEESESLDNGGVLHTSAHDYYLNLDDGRKELIIPKHAPLPAQKKCLIELKSKDQTLLHLSLSNQIGDSFENVGHLWLSTSEGDNEDVNDDKTQIELDFTISEDNLLFVSSRCSNNSKFNLSQSISRGKEDELLYLEVNSLLEKSKDADYYCKRDLQYRLEHAVPVIHQVLDKQTENFNKKNFKDAKQQLYIAGQSLNRNASILGNIYYLESRLDCVNDIERNASNAMKYKELKNKLKKLRKDYFTTDIDMLEERKELLFDEFDEHFPKSNDYISGDAPRENYQVESGFSLLS